MSQGNNPPIRVSVSEAARLFGVSSTTIRLALKRQELKYIVVRGRYKINFESLIAWSQKSKRRQNILSSQGIGQFVDKWRIKNRLFSPGRETARSFLKEKNPAGKNNKREDA